MTAPRSLPPVIRIEPSSACNLKCRHCPTGVVEMPRALMSPAVFERVISEVKKHVPPIRAAVLYHGGEPFLNKHFLSMVRQTKDTGIPFVKTVSNGMAIKDARSTADIDAIVTSGLDAIELSADGTSAAENDFIRRGSRFEHIVDVVRALAERNRALGRPLKIFVATTQFRPADAPADAVATAPAVLREALAGLLDEVSFKATWAVRWPSGDPKEGFDVAPPVPPPAPVRSCSLLEDTMTIRADGTVVACCYDLTTMTNVGNILHASLEDIWFGPALSAVRSALASGSPAPLCAGCAVVTGPAYLRPLELVSIGRAPITA